ncbi:MAG TPA: hypothetical protein VFM18_13970 [Methanosarcina sp.]|nr:hypothetical protein [Methanosarcina sp.]
MKKTALVLRCNASDMSSYGGFIWPGVGQVAECQDWIPDEECGHGLHGWLYGHGDYRSSSYVGQPDAKWLVVEVNEEDIIDLDGKVKFPRGVVRYVGDKAGATGYLTEHEPRSANDAIIGLVKNVGYEQSAMGGNYSVLTSGNYSTLTGGDCSTLNGGNGSTLNGGDCSTLTGGEDSTLTGGIGSTLTGGDCSTLSIKWFDHETNRYRISIAYVGEDGIEPNVAYKLDDKGKFIKASKGK